MNTETKAISANNAMAILSRQNLQPHKEFTLHVKTLSPNKIGGTACVRVVEIYQGIGWDNGKFLIETEHQLTQLSPEDVAAIHKSAKEGQSWHAYQQYMKHADEIKDLKAQLADAKKDADLSMKGLRTAVIALAAAAEMNKNFQSSYQSVSDCIEAIQAEGKA